MELLNLKLTFMLFLFFSSIVKYSVSLQYVHNNKTSINNASAVISLPLFPYASILKQHQHHLNYTELVQSRLASDAARINSINSIIQYKIHHGNFSGNNTKAFQQAGISPGTPVFPNYAGVYLVRIGVGRPEKQAFLMVDTGNSLTWIQCQQCTHCFRQFGPRFDPYRSSTFATLPCSSRQCNSFPKKFKQCSGQFCGYDISYSDGTYTAGILATETLNFNGFPIKGVVIGCGLDMNTPGLGDSAGPLGLGAGPESFPSQIRASTFSYCLVDMDSKNQFSTLEFNSAPPRDSVFVPMIRNPKIAAGHYYVGLTGISVGGKLLPIPRATFQIDGNGNGGVILDTGSTHTHLPKQAYEPLMNAIWERTRGISRDKTDSTCFLINCARDYERFPDVGLVFGNGKTVLVARKNYLRLDRGSGGGTRFCSYFWETKGSLSVIGMAQQQGIRITYDLAIKRIGFSPNKC
ncbi:OLC1v1014238C1 [Oldenlandia corymbosa var. corymbosa]|uniref:OLC1v1014238C1 n=1 Tax=Oldenlandia corymbosa var. corymbosa TaxID=529605 RepID=A0AAV1E3J7_OLDCO|nr:OLC1v1014238C1 [Oldenlandia corymbosa var. corymbosa]